jgi:hypothetical protein
MMFDVLEPWQIWSTIACLIHSKTEATSINREASICTLLERG